MINKCKIDQSIPVREPENLIKSLVNCKSIESNDINFSDPEKDNMVGSLYLILNIMNSGCKSAFKEMKKLDLIDLNNSEERLKSQISLFKTDYAFAMSAQFFTELSKTLENYTKFLKDEMNEDNLLEQYQFY
jgi:hypothetical protein